MDSSNSGKLDHPAGQAIYKKKKQDTFHNLKFYCDEEAKTYINGRKIPKIFKHVSLVASEGHVLSSITQTGPKVTN